MQIWSRRNNVGEDVHETRILAVGMHFRSHCDRRSKSIGRAYPVERQSYYPMTSSYLSVRSRSFSSRLLTPTPYPVAVRMASSLPPWHCYNNARALRRPDILPHSSLVVRINIFAAPAKIFNWFEATGSYRTRLLYCTCPAAAHRFWTL